MAVYFDNFCEMDPRTLGINELQLNRNNIERCIAQHYQGNSTYHVHNVLIGLLTNCLHYILKLGCFSLISRHFILDKY